MSRSVFGHGRPWVVSNMTAWPDSPGWPAIPFDGRDPLAGDRAYPPIKGLGKALIDEVLRELMRAESVLVVEVTTRTVALAVSLRESPSR